MSQLTTHIIRVPVTGTWRRPWIKDQSEGQGGAIIKKKKWFAGIDAHNIVIVLQIPSDNLPVTPLNQVKNELSFP